MKQAVMTAPGEMELRDVEAPEPGPGEVLIRIRRIGVCGSDVHVWHGTHPFTGYPVVQGHELAGTVEALGNGVDGPSVGTKVTALPQVTCGRCPPCRRGDWHICENLRVRGFQAPGAAQEYFAAPAERVVALPENFTFEQGAMVEPVAVAVHAVARGGDLAGRNVAVLGAGPIGNLVAQVASASAGEVLITDVSDHRLEVARQCGLGAGSNPRNEPLPQAAGRVFGDPGFSVAFECAAVESALSAAVESIAKGGTVVVVGVFGQSPRVNMGLVQDRELSLLGTLMYRREDYLRAVELMAGGTVDVGPLVSEHFSLDGYAEAYRRIDETGEKVMKLFIDV